MNYDLLILCFRIGRNKVGAEITVVPCTLYTFR